MSVATRYGMVRLDTLTIDSRVQRHEGIDERRVAKMAANFKVPALGTITVSQRDNGQIVIIDGAHRTAAARQAGYTGAVHAVIHTGLTIEQEAELFLLLNEFKSPSALSRFLVRVVMGEPEAAEMHAIATSHGWRFVASRDPGCITAVDSMERVYRNGGGTKPVGRHAHLLDQVFEVVTAAWEHDGKSTNGHILLAVAQLYGRFESGVDTKKLVTEMAQTRPDVLIGKARALNAVQGGTVPAAMAKILAGMHNSRRRTNLLPEWVWIR